MFNDTWTGWKTVSFVWSPLFVDQDRPGWHRSQQSASRVSCPTPTPSPSLLRSTTASQLSRPSLVWPRPSRHQWLHSIPSWPPTSSSRRSPLSSPPRWCWACPANLPMWRPSRQSRPLPSLPKPTRWFIRIPTASWATATWPLTPASSSLPPCPSPMDRRRRCTPSLQLQTIRMVPTGCKCCGQSGVGSTSSVTRDTPKVNRLFWLVHFTTERYYCFVWMFVYFQKDHYKLHGFQGYIVADLFGSELERESKIEHCLLTNQVLMALCRWWPFPFVRLCWNEIHRPLPSVFKPEQFQMPALINKALNIPARSCWDALCNQKPIHLKADPRSQE